MEMNMPDTIQTIHYLLILDRSGSMERVRQITIDGFNEQVQTTRDLQERFPDQHYTVSLTVFNDDAEERLFMVPASDLHELSPEDYLPRGRTALHDAVGQAVTRLEPKVAPEDKVIVTIFTDGQENASREYSFEAIRSMIARLQEHADWTFTYVGAGQGVIEQAQGLNIDITNVMVYDASAAGTERAFAAMHRSREAYADKVRSGRDVKKGFFAEDDTPEEKPPTA
jgi:hypothetical protein